MANIKAGNMKNLALQDGIGIGMVSNIVESGELTVFRVCRIVPQDGTRPVLLYCVLSVTL